MDEFKFECRICGSKEYSEERIGSVLGPRGSSWVRNYVCNGCSIVFKDVNKFTKKVEEKKIEK